MNLIGWLRLLTLICLSAANAARAQGFLDWKWSFDKSQFVVGPSDTISLTATISVRPEAPRPLTGRASFTFQGSLFASYDFDCAFCRDIRLADVNIPPGGSLQFEYGTLVPRFSLPPGIYRNIPDQPLIDFEALGTRHIPEAPLVIQVIPEPSTLVIFGIGGALLRASCRSRFRARDERL